LARVRPIGTIVQSRRYRLSCEGCPRPELRLRKVSPIQVPAFRPGTSVIGHIKRTPAGVPLGSRETEKQDPFLGAKVVATSVAGLIAVEKFEDGRSRLDCDWSSSTEEVRTLREVLDSRSPPTVVRVARSLCGQHVSLWYGCVRTLVESWRWKASCHAFGVITRSLFFSSSSRRVRSQPFH